MRPSPPSREADKVGRQSRRMEHRLLHGGAHPCAHGQLCRHVSPSSLDPADSCAELGILSGTTTSARIVGFLAANFATGPGLTGWFMTACLGVMVYFSLEKSKRKNFERFWYFHHLFILFFVLWQFHGHVPFPDRNVTNF